MPGKVRFGVFEFDPSRRELRRQGLKIRVPGQSLEVLAALVEHPGEIVTRERIRGLLWPHGTVVEFEQSIRAVVKRLREAIGDPAVSPRFIERVPRQGYRFIATVEALPPSPAIAPELCTGKILLHYRLVEKVGQGSMGEVWRAEDGKLGRIVALKFLPEHLAEDPEALEAFRAEARHAAALNDPNICSIYGLEENNGWRFLVFEYIDGLPLSAALAGAPLPVVRILDIGIQAATALAAAHKAGIIHRDIKPANLMLTSDGRVKLTDFGVAKAARGSDAALTNNRRRSPTGTLAYMSPEQARGDPVDARSDLFSLGAVLYEIATGKTPFGGDTPAAVLDAVLHRSPTPPCEMNRQLPPELEQVILKALEKEPGARWQSASAMTEALHRIRSSPAKGRRIFRDWRKNPERSFQGMDNKDPSLGELEEAPAEPRRSRLVYWIAAAAAVFICLGLWPFMHLFQRESQLPEPRIVPMTVSSGVKGAPSISPDGNWIAFMWNGEKLDNRDIYVKEVDGPGFNRLTTDPADDCCPEWSPDGRQIAFLRSAGNRQMLYITSLLGGVERRLVELETSDRLSWNPEDRLSWSPDGRTIAYSAEGSSNDRSSIWALSVDTLERKRLTEPPADTLGDVQPTYSPDGRYLAFMRRMSGSQLQLFITPLPRGSAQLVTGDNSPYWPCWTADSQELVFGTTAFVSQNALWRMPLKGGVPRRIPSRGETVFLGSVSRNRIAFVSLSGNTDIWRLELDGGLRAKAPAMHLSTWSSDEYSPHISPDGSRLAFASMRTGPSEIWVSDSGFTRPVKLTDMQATSSGSPRWSPDGKRIAFDSTKYGSSDIFAADTEGGPVRRITTDSTDEVVPRWSRDGRWIYFGSNRDGSWQIWKVPSGGGSQVQVTRNGGIAALESADGYLYYYPSPKWKQGLWRMPLSGGPATLVIDAVFSLFSWDLTDRGLYFVKGTKPLPTICFYDPAKRRAWEIAPVHTDLRFVFSLGLGVSHDDRWMVYPGGFLTDEIKVIDNFR